MPALTAAAHSGSRRSHKWTNLQLPGVDLEMQISTLAARGLSGHCTHCRSPGGPSDNMFKFQTAARARPAGPMGHPTSRPGLRSASGGDSDGPPSESMLTLRFPALRRRSDGIRAPRYRFCQRPGDAPRRLNPVPATQAGSKICCEYCRQLRLRRLRRNRRPGSRGGARLLLPGTRATYPPLAPTTTFSLLWS